MIENFDSIQLLNQVYTGLWPPRAWFLKILSVQTSVCVVVCVCVCPPLRLLITSGMICTPYDWLNKFYNCYMTNVVSNSVSLMGMALALMRIIKTNPIRVS